MKVASLVSRVTASPIRKLVAILAEAQKHADIISFGAGAPSFPPPPELQAQAQILSSQPDSYKYGTTQGMAQLRSFISEDLKKDGVHYTPSQIAITEGCTEGLWLALMSLVDPGDEVVLFDPTYLGYPEPVKMIGANIKWVKTKDTKGFQPDEEGLKKAISKKTKAILVASPVNPTGMVLTEQSTKMIADLAKDAKCWIIFDETYRDFIYGKARHSFMAKYAPDNTIGCFSFSKIAAIPGMRLGYNYAPKAVIEAMEKIQQYIMLCPNTFSQKLVLKFFEGEIRSRFLNKLVLPAYRKRRSAMARALKKHLPQLRFGIPDGAFYFFPDFSAYMGKRNEESFCQWLLEKARVGVIPGNFFGKGGEKHIRLTFVSEDEQRIDEGVQRIAKLVEK